MNITKRNYRISSISPSLSAGASEFRFRDFNHIAVFNNSKQKIHLKVMEITQIVQNILQAPLLTSSDDWLEYKSFYHCTTVIHPHFEKFVVIADFVKLHASNWLAPPNPVSISSSWTSQDQRTLEAIITAKSGNGESFNATAVRETSMREKYESVVSKVFDQREDAFVILSQIDAMLQDLQHSLSNFLLLIAVCHGNSEFGAKLAQLSCPGLLLPTQLPLYQVESLHCLANPKKLIVSYRLHQEEKLFSNGVFQKGVIVSSALSLAVQFAVYSCMVFRIIRTYRRNKTAALRTALRKSAKRPETRPLVHTGQVALNSVYVPPKTK